jgi:predicted short-subunit dehydrogenase-like oxidoreductase (DUF2520 family)
MPIGIIGAGAVGLALARALVTVGLPPILIGARQPTTFDPTLTPVPIATGAEVVAHARLVFLAVPDDAIVAVAQGLPWRADQWVAHCAGSQPADLLTTVVAPAQAAAFHPLAAFTRPTLPPAPQENALAGRVIALDGAPLVVAGLRALALHLGGQPLAVPPTARPGYHLAASLASNALVALLAEAVDTWRAAGLPEDLALPALLPLIASTQANLARVGLPTALTGPIARGDVATVARHLRVLADDPDLAIIYRLLGLRAVALARDMGRVAPATLAAIAALLRAE